MIARDEWVVLPIAGQVEPRRFRRDDIGDYWPRQFPEGEAVMLMRRNTDLMFTIPLPLAEFEALLFAPAPAPAASDEYTRVAVRYAEAQMRAMSASSFDAAAGIELRHLREEFWGLYREHHDAGYAGDALRRPA